MNAYITHFYSNHDLNVLLIDLKIEIRLRLSGIRYLKCHFPIK